MPCSRHLKEIFKLVDKLQCYCREYLKPLGYTSCCNKAPRKTPIRRSRSRASEKPTAKPCCGPALDGTVDDIIEPYHARNEPSHSNIHSHAPTRAGRPLRTARHDCNELLEADNPKLEATTTTYFKDVELGLLDAEHVVLSVHGMTCCSSCERKLIKALERIPYIRNVKTSFALVRAEFDLDPSAASVEDVINKVNAWTGFRCERLIVGEHHLVVVVNGSVNELVASTAPPGVLDIEVLDKRHARIKYDPTVIGPRDILNSYDVGLALASLDQISSNGGWWTSFLRILRSRLAPSKTESTLDKDLWENFLLMTALILLTTPVLVFSYVPQLRDNIRYSAVSLVFASVVQILIIRRLYVPALKALWVSRAIEMDLLVVLSTSVAYIYSVVAFAFDASGHALSQGDFFETSTVLTTLIVMGKYLAALAQHSAINTVSVRSLQDNHAILILPDGKEETIDARLLHYGDVFKAMPHSRFVTDGVVATGESEVDESMITGESKPIHKTKHSTVIAGSLNGGGALTVTLSTLPSDNTVSKIAAMVDEATFNKPRIQLIADRVASWFVPTILVLAVVTFFAWFGTEMRDGVRGSEAAVDALGFAIAVLVISCPCAIGLAVPMVAVVASGIAARRGVIMKSGMVIERAKSVTHVVLDKTGTLTEGKMSVAEERHLMENSTLAAALVLGLLQDINHPVSAAVARHLKSRNVSAVEVQNVTSVPGKGVTGQYGAEPLRAGNSRWLGMEDHPTVKDFLSKHYSVFCVSMSGNPIAIYGLQDTLRPDSVEVIGELQRRKITVSIISGDDQGVVEAIANELHIPLEHAHAQQTPQQKKEYIESLSRASKSTILYIGDGTNDAPALKAATIGVSFAQSKSQSSTAPASTQITSDIAAASAPVLLLNPSIAGILTLIDISRMAHRRIVFNFSWSFVYNTVAILLTGGVLERAGRGFRIPPQYAGLGELVSVVPVVVAALMMRWVKV